MVEIIKQKKQFIKLIELLGSYIYLLLYIRPFKGKKETLKPTLLEESFQLVQINEQCKSLLSAYGSNVLRLAYSYLHNMSDAEDVLQDTLIQFIKIHPKFESIEHEKAWFLRVAINISKNRIIYNKIRKTDELSEVLAASQTEDLSFVWDAVKQLPLKYSEVIHLYYHEGYTTAEVASILAKKESTIRSLLQRARIKLKYVLKEVYDFGE